VADADRRTWWTDCSTRSRTGWLLTHGRLQKRVKVCQLGGSSSIGSIDSPLSSSVTPLSFPGLKPSFSANPSHRSLPFLLQDWLHGFPGVFTDTSVHIRFFTFTFFSFLVVGSVRRVPAIDLRRFQCRLLSAHSNSISCRIVAYC